jgi:hypothetical protein
MINFTKLQEFKIHTQMVEFVKSLLANEIDSSALSAIKRALRVTYPDYFTVLMQPTQAAARVQLTEVLNKFHQNTTTDPAYEQIFTSLQSDLIALFSNETMGKNDNTDYFALHFASWSKYIDSVGLNPTKFFNDFLFDLDQVELMIFGNVEMDKEWLQVLPYCEFMGQALKCADIATPIFSYASGTQCFLIDVNQHQYMREFGLRLVVNAHSTFGDPTFPSIPEGFQVQSLL